MFEHVRQNIIREHKWHWISIYVNFFIDSPQPLDQVETLSDIADVENAVDDLSDDDKDPRLILPKLKPNKAKKVSCAQESTREDIQIQLCSRWVIRWAWDLNVFPCVSFQRKKKDKLKEKKKKLVITKYIPFKQSGFVKRVVLFRPNPESKVKKRPAWYLPPVIRPRSRPWSAMIRRMRAARAFQVSPLKPIPSIPPLSHKLHGN